MEPTGWLLLQFGHQSIPMHLLTDILDNDLDEIIHAASLVFTHLPLANSNT